jgi:large conductance mechanosensitive channel
MLKGFRDFLLKGDLITAAVGLVMALATFALTEALVGDLITPLIGAIIGEPNFNDLHFTINGSEFAYGSFIDALIVFVATVAAVYFFVVLPYQPLPEAERRHRSLMERHDSSRLQRRLDVDGPKTSRIGGVFGPSTFRVHGTVTNVPTL